MKLHKYIYKIQKLSVIKFPLIILIFFILLNSCWLSVSPLFNRDISIEWKNIHETITKEIPIDSVILTFREGLGIYYYTGRHTMDLNQVLHDFKNPYYSRNATYILKYLLDKKIGAVLIPTHVPPGDFRYDLFCNIGINSTFFKLLKHPKLFSPIYYTKEYVLLKRVYENPNFTGVSEIITFANTRTWRFLSLLKEGVEDEYLSHGNTLYIGNATDIQRNLFIRMTLDTSGIKKNYNNVKYVTAELIAIAKNPYTEEIIQIMNYSQTQIMSDLEVTFDFKLNPEIFPKKSKELLNDPDGIFELLSIKISDDDELNIYFFPADFRFTRILYYEKTGYYLESKTNLLVEKSTPRPLLQLNEEGGIIRINSKSYEVGISTVHGGILYIKHNSFQIANSGFLRIHSNNTYFDSSFEPKANYSLILNSTNNLILQLSGDFYFESNHFPAHFKYVYGFYPSYFTLFWNTSWQKPKEVDELRYDFSVRFANALLYYDENGTLHTIDLTDNSGMDFDKREFNVKNNVMIFNDDKNAIGIISKNFNVTYGLWDGLTDTLSIYSIYSPTLMSLGECVVSNYTFLMGNTHLDIIEYSEAGSRDET